MFEMQHNRIDVRRELVSLNYEGLRGVNASAASVDEAMGRLRELEGKFRGFHEQGKINLLKKSGGDKASGEAPAVESRKDRLDRIKEEDKDRKVWREGRLVHRTEPELKTHTSYLVFAILPMEWVDQDEEEMEYGE
jgi:tRNA (adenine57-N1/adenine58-N1)-methyltransferase